VLPLDLLHALLDVLRRWRAAEIVVALVVRQTTSWYATPRFLLFKSLDERAASRGCRARRCKYFVEQALERGFDGCHR
jgi:hypothetical protein